MSSAISVNSVSKRYRLGEINRGQLLADLHRWWMRRKTSSPERRGQSEAEPKEEGDFWALKDVSFEVEQGKTIGIIGANGAGKSTLLKIISRITAPTWGSVRLKGRVGSLLEVGTGFHPELTGRDNVFMNGAILGMSRAEVRRKFDDIVAFAAIEEFIDTPVKRYSSGMYVRLAFAVSAFLEPEILILDEVLAVGDLAFRVKCFKRLEELISSRHTILFVAHDIALVTRFCDKVVWLEKGSVKDFGAAETVTEGYQKALAKPNSAAAQKGYEHGGSGEVVVTSIELLNAQGEAVDLLVCGERCWVRLDCERRFERTGKAAGTGARITFYDEFGRRIFSLSSIYGEPQLPAPPSQASIWCEIPKLPLLPGGYKLNYQLFIDDQCVDEQTSARTFQVAPGKYYGTSRLPVRTITPLCVDCSWRLEPVESSRMVALDDAAGSSLKGKGPL
jgi:homopolymeric O-antigen transport system ATP-binding protein